jgi:hypothetical protein
MAWLSFMYFDLGAAITGGLVTNLGAALNSLGSALTMLGPWGMLIPILGGALFGMIFLLLFPLDWVLLYRPDQPMMMLAIVIPWILCCTITAALFAHSPKGGLTTSIAIGLGYMIPTIVIYFLIPIILNAIIPLGLGGVVSGIIDDLFYGATDRPFILAVVTAVGEGCLIGGIFGAFIGSLKYKPGEKEEKVVTPEPALKKAESKKKKEKKEKYEPSVAPNICVHCGAKLEPTDSFCTNCGAKR